MTRCRTRQKILIYRPFPLAPFQEGLLLGRQLLLDVWKQEPVDWDALRKKYLDERPCHECGEMKRKDAFTKAQWKQDTYRVCKECSARKREAGTPYRCTQCGLWHAAAHFASKHQNTRWSMYRVCLSCDAVKHCFACKRKQTKEYFGTAAWTARKPNRRVCLQCQTRTQGFWTCAACHQRRPQLQFSTLSSGLREKMELRYVTLVTQKLRRKFSASEQRQPPLHGWSRCVKEFAVLRFCERHGKQLPKSEMHNNCSQANFLQRRIQWSMTACRELSTTHHARQLHSRTRRTTRKLHGGSISTHVHSAQSLSPAAFAQAKLITVMPAATSFAFMLAVFLAARTNTHALDAGPS